MRKVIVVALLAVILFGLSAGGSWFLKQLQDQKAKSQGEETASGTETTAKEKERAPEPRGTGGELPRGGLTGRREFNSEADATVQQAARLRDQQEELRRREDQFNARLKNLDLIKQDIRGERDAMDRLRTQLTEEKKVAEETLLGAERKLRQSDEKQSETKAFLEEQKKKLTEVDATRFSNIKRVGGVSETMNPADAATIIMSMADTGNLDTAALLLSNMKDRKAADVLSQIPDKALAAQLLEKMISLKQTSTTPAAGLGAPGRPGR